MVEYPPCTECDSTNAQFAATMIWKFSPQGGVADVCSTYDCQDCGARYDGPWAVGTTDRCPDECPAAS